MKDLIQVYALGEKKTRETLQTAPWSLLISLGLSLVFYLFNLLVSRLIFMGAIVGFIVALGYAAIVAYGMSIYEGVLNRGKPKLVPSRESLKYLSAVYGIYFILMIARLITGIGGSYGNIFFALFFLLNPLPEAIYLDQQRGVEGLKHVLDFWKRNFFHWLLPLLIYLGLQSLLLTPQGMIGGILGSDIVNQMSGFTVIRIGGSWDPVFILRQILSLLFTGWYMILRGQLYRILRGGSARKRAFMAHFQ
ncbi:MAG: hypothetical protein Q4E76_04105 [Tissierellia bacterium]|nr:hypothetical protein [Tissierellia bacterium]